MSIDPQIDPEPCLDPEMTPAVRLPGRSGTSRPGVTRPGAGRPAAASARGLIVPSRILPAALREAAREETTDPHPGASPTWCLETVAGRFVEISSAGTTTSITAAAFLVREAQLRGEPAAWVATGRSSFFPPDLRASGIDLEALPVIRVPDVPAAARAADRLLRSGAFALVVLDLAQAGSPGRPARSGVPPIPVPSQTRLVGLCRKHRSALVCLTETPSLGSLVSLRGEGAVRKTAFDRFTWELQILKDKRQGPGWSHTEVCRGPDGLC